MLAKNLHGVDYLFISLHLIFTIFVGFGGKVSCCLKSTPTQEPRETMESYVLGSRAMSTLLVSVSLVSGLMSGVSFLGSPGFSYQHGAGALVGYFASSFIQVFVGAHVMLPHFYKSKALTSYSALEVRFSRSLRKAAAFTFILKMVFYLGIVYFVFMYKSFV